MKDGPLAGVRVLVVENDVDSAEMITAVLQHAGADVRTVPSGAIALAECAASLPMVVLTDVAMPDMDGFQLLKQLRGAGHAALPAVALSAHAEAAYVDRAELAGFAAYLSKPIDPAKLVATLRKVLG